MKQRDKRHLKSLFAGLLFGFSLTWLLALLLPPILVGMNSLEFIQKEFNDILSISLEFALLGSFIQLIYDSVSRKRRKHEEFEEAVIKYLKEKEEKEKE